MAVNNTLEHVRDVILSAHEGTTSREKIDFYNGWARNYDQDVAVLEYNAPSLAADSVSAHFSGDRGAAVVLDVACGTGLAAKRLRERGFRRFVGIDGSERMLELAGETGLYQDLKRCVLGEEPLPVPCGTFDVVVIVGALSAGQVPVGVIRDLCQATKRGGSVCMTTRSNADNKDYKAALEKEMERMEEEEGLWSCLEASAVEKWERAVSERDGDYISGCVYLFKKL